MHLSTNWKRALVLIALILVFVLSVLLFPPPGPEAPSGAAPVANDDVLSLPTETSPASALVTSNDSDPDGDLDALSLAITRPPDAGTARVDLEGSIVYSPDRVFEGSDELEYEVCDTDSNCARATVTVRVRPVELSGSTVRFAMFGDYGDHSEGAVRVAALVDRLDPDFIVTTGDNSYDVPDYDLNVGSLYSDYVGSYQGGNGIGAQTNRFFPALGDHEYSDGGIEPYLEFFNLPGDRIETSGTSGNERYYDFVMGPAHFFILNVQPQEPDGMSPSSRQGRWLQDQLAASTSPWRLVVSPVPPFSSGNNHGSDPSVQWPYDEWGADAVFSGDDHVYERIVLDGLPYFVSGLGGRSMYGFGPPVEGSEARYADDFGVLIVEACDSGLGFEFHSISDEIVDRFAVGDGFCPSGKEPSPLASSKAAAKLTSGRVK
jgi:hypothetical protein